MKLTDTNIYALPGTKNRFVHLATVHDSLHEYICFMDLINWSCYIEEITGGNLKFVEEDKLAFDLAKFLEGHGVTDMKHVIERVKIWQRSQPSV